jgi:hypothetical protein
MAIDACSRLGGGCCADGSCDQRDNGHRRPVLRMHNVRSCMGVLAGVRLSSSRRSRQALRWGATIAIRGRPQRTHGISVGSASLAGHAIMPDGAKGSSNLGPEPPIPRSDRNAARGWAEARRGVGRSRSDCKFARKCSTPNHSLPSGTAVLAGCREPTVASTSRGVRAGNPSSAGRKKSVDSRV